MRTELIKALERQLPTLLLYRHVGKHQMTWRTLGTDTATLYVILFPGESADGTGLKQLNDKVLYYDLNSKFIRERQKIIESIFAGTPGGPGFITVGQDYKTASIIAVGKTRREFAAQLIRLDRELKTALEAALKEAEDEALRKESDEDEADDEKSRRERLRAIKAVRKAINRRKWRFDFLFGSASQPVTKKKDLEAEFLLLTEALKAAGVARFIAKADAVGGWSAGATDIARKHRVDRDSKDDDDRGKHFQLRQFQKTLGATEAVRDLMSQGPSAKTTWDYYNIFVNGVWTFPWLIFHPDEQRLIANPDVVRDARKRLLVKPKLGEGMKHSFKAQVRLLELWLVAINTIDLIKDFVVPEFKDELLWYHRRTDDSYVELTGTGQVDGRKLQTILTRDLRQGRDPFPVLGRTSEFQFYARASDEADRIFFVMDVRDLGVDLLIPYELSADAILWRKLANERMMFETFWASDPVTRRKRATYNAVVEEFRAAHKKARGTAWKRHVQEAFGRIGGAAIKSMPSFEDSLVMMMGGDEFFVAAHPAYAGHEAEIIKGLAERLYEGLPFNLRTAVAYSSADWASTEPTVPPSPEQRKRNADAHDEALATASAAPRTLKEFERTHRRLERLIEKVPRDPRREPKPDPKRDKEREEKAKKYREDLDKLGLLRLYARAKHSEPGPTKPASLRRFLAALKAGDVRRAKAVTDVKFDLVDFNGRVVEAGKIRRSAVALEKLVAADARRNNVHFDPPPIIQKPKIPKWLKEVLSPWAYKMIHEWYEDDGRKEWEWKRDPKPPPDLREA